mmetsp:Transcript_30989/g.90331  ORF Transcript_30989/g.90331 Transcript_30989/m.90331 type:complete len:254 (+) Transcript_30989:657-1418(+)
MPPAREDLALRVRAGRGGLRGADASGGARARAGAVRARAPGGPRRDLQPPGGHLHRQRDAGEVFHGEAPCFRQAQHVDVPARRQLLHERRRVPAAGEKGVLRRELGAGRRKEERKGGGRHPVDARRRRRGRGVCKDRRGRARRSPAHLFTDGVVVRSAGHRLDDEERRAEVPPGQVGALADPHTTGAGAEAVGADLLRGVPVRGRAGRAFEGHGHRGDQGAAAGGDDRRHEGQVSRMDGATEAAMSRCTHNLR